MMVNVDDGKEVHEQGATREIELSRILLMALRNDLPNLADRLSPATHKAYKDLQRFHECSVAVRS